MVNCAHHKIVMLRTYFYRQRRGLRSVAQFSGESPTPACGLAVHGWTTSATQKLQRDAARLEEASSVAHTALNARKTA